MNAIEAKAKTQENRIIAIENDLTLKTDLWDILTLIEKAVDEGLNFTTYKTKCISKILLQHLKVDLQYDVTVDFDHSTTFVYISWH